MHRNVVPLSYPYPAQRRPFTANLVRLWGYSCGKMTRTMLSLPMTQWQPTTLSTISSSKSLLTLSCCSVQIMVRSLSQKLHSAFGKVSLKKFSIIVFDMFYLLCYVYNITLFERLVKSFGKLFLSFFMTDSVAKCEGLPDDRPCGAGRVMW